jgi:hypothetical protein
MKFGTQLFRQCKSQKQGVKMGGEELEIIFLIIHVKVGSNGRVQWIK